VSAVVVDRPNELEVRDVAPPVPAAGEVLVRSHRAGICRTDLDVATGLLDDPRSVRDPVVLADGWGGVVAGVGGDVEELAPGDRVVCEGIIPCGRCRSCRRVATRLWENHDQLGFTRLGGHAELATAPRQVVHRLPDPV
jgi:D-arabinose 1-dehydrogenase-like Zn-dependent alcohol dehydrogenase